MYAGPFAAVPKDKESGEKDFAVPKDKESGEKDLVKEESCEEKCI